MKYSSHILLSACSILGITALPARSAEVVSYQTPGDTPSAAYTLRVNGKDVFVTAFHGVHYAHFACDGNARVEVGFSLPVGSVKVRPLRLGIEPEIDGASLFFSVAFPEHSGSTIVGHPRHKIKNLLIENVTIGNRRWEKPEDLKGLFRNVDNAVFQ